MFLQPGGNSPYTYSWNTFPTPTAGTSVSGLAKGFYTVTATDAAGCQGQYSFTVNGPSDITINYLLLWEPLVLIVSDGSATVVASGGNGGFTYLWDDPSSQTGATASNIFGRNL